ncbi:MAG: peptidase [Cyanobacteriota bacterium]|nr:peptidase [Cyanobacteriota bacterium]
MGEAPPPSRPLPLLAWCRQAHALVGPVVLAPLVLTAVTGVSYRILRDWLGWGRDRAHGLMTLHEGEWLKALVGVHGETVYVALNGLGLLWMAGTGSALAWQRLRRRGGTKGSRVP